MTANVAPEGASEFAVGGRADISSPRSTRYRAVEGKRLTLDCTQKDLEDAIAAVHDRVRALTRVDLDSMVAYPVREWLHAELVAAVAAAAAAVLAIAHLLDG